MFYYQIPVAHASIVHTYRTNLYINPLFHLDLKPHRCDLCQKGFTTPSYLRLHVLTVHKGMRLFFFFFSQYSCKSFRMLHYFASPDVCIFASTLSCSSKYYCLHLKCHICLILGVKAYSCPHCPKRYTQKHSLKKHINSQHLFGKQNLPFIC